jgi:hypothetical protein
MKNLARCLVMLMLMSVASNVYAQNWVAYQEVVQTQTTYIPQPQPVVVYQWVPYVSQQNFVIEKQRIFCKTQTVVSRPFTQWVLQPVVIYR